MMLTKIKFSLIKVHRTILLSKYIIILLIGMAIDRSVSSIISSNDSLSIHELLYFIPPVLVFFLRRHILLKNLVVEFNDN